MLAEFHFLRPGWLVAIPFVVAAAAWFAWRRLGAGHWQGVVDTALIPYVLSRRQARHSDLRWWLLGIGGVTGALALAGPAWERIEQPVFRSDQALVVGLDLSRSMDAQDVSPSRVTRAKLKILDLLDRRGSGQTALVVYSSNAFTVTPLTTDGDTVAALVNSLSTDIMPSRGSYPVAAIEKGRRLLEQAGVSAGEVLLITDGGASPAAERAARDLRETGYTLSVLGVGTREGAPIPRQGGGFITDSSGQMAVPRLEEGSLGRLASAGGGKYATLTADDSDLDYLLSGETVARNADGDSQATDQWREEGPWLVLLLLPLAALAFRRGWVFVAVMFLGPLPQPAEASLWDDLWRNPDQQGARLLENGEAGAAAETFEDPDWEAVARYRAGDYASSAARFAESGDARSLYNLGNALARQGEFESAIDAYDQVLEIDPGDEDAAYNRDLLEQALEQQKQEQQQQGENQESSERSGEQNQDSSESGESEEQSDSGSDSNSDSESGQDKQSDRGDDPASEEAMQALKEELERAAEEAENQERGRQELSEAELEALRRQQAEQQAMEQWLRRIPNDPGGLLRRKFRYQYQREGRDQDGNNLWPDNEEQPW